MKIFLVGPMGSGKSKIGKLLSSEINLNLIDIDKEIEAKFEKTIKVCQFEQLYNSPT